MGRNRESFRKLKGAGKKCWQDQEVPAKNAVPALKTAAKTGGTQGSRPVRQAQREKTGGRKWRRNPWKAAESAGLFINWRQKMPAYMA